MEQWTIAELRKRIREKKIGVVELISTHLKWIEKTEPVLKAFITIDKEGAMKKAQEIEEKIMKEEDAGILAGIPISIKDNLVTKGLRTTCGSRILENFIPPYSATVVKLLENAGAISLGKANMDEFAMGSSTENSGFYPSRNPWDIECIPGGSSGGSAVNVAGLQVVASIGTDTGGSIRQPACMCGVCGLKPTYGRVSRYGLVAYASSLEQAGVLARNIMDIAEIMNVIAVHDPRDSSSVFVQSSDYVSAVRKNNNTLRAGIPKEYFTEGVEKEVEKNVRSAISKFAKIGVEIVEISLPHAPYCVPAYYLIATAEASSNLARYDGVKYGIRDYGEEKDLLEMYKQTRKKGFRAEVKRRIMLGTYALSAGYYDAYYLKAQKVRTFIKNDFDEAFKKCDIILTPTSPVSKCGIGERISDPLQMYLLDIYTISVNLAGVPALSIPCGFDSTGHPIGLQIIGRPFEEDIVLKAGYMFEQVLGLSRKIPDFDWINKSS